MNKLTSLSDAIKTYVHAGDYLAIGGYTTSRKPLAAVAEIIRQGIDDLIIEGGSAGSDCDMLIGAGCVKAYINCYTANPRFSNVSRRFRAAAERGEILLEDYSQDVSMMLYHAAALGVSYIPVKWMMGSGMEKEWGIGEEVRKTIPKLPNKKFVVSEDPFHPGERILLVPTPDIDVSILHVQMASPDGTCRIYGDKFADVDLAFAAKRTIVTCEELVSNDYIRLDPEKNSIPGLCVDAVIHLPFGAHPSQVYGFYDYDSDFYEDYDRAGRTEDSFAQWTREWIYQLPDHRAYLEKLGALRLLDLKTTTGKGYHVEDVELTRSVEYAD